MSHCNNRSALQNKEFVSQSVADLVQTRVCSSSSFSAFGGQSVECSYSKFGEETIDLSILNKFVKRDKFKFEDWKIAVQYFEKENCMYKFDLKSGYLHLDICPQHQTYLGYEWGNKFNCYTVLPFGLTTGPNIHLQNL